MKQNTTFILSLFFSIFFLVFPRRSQGQTAFEMILGSSAQYKDVTVNEVLSADTFKLENGKKIKLIGLRAPKAPKEKKSEVERDQYGFRIKETVSLLTPIEEQAFDFVVELLEGNRVRLEFDSNKKDDDNMTLAYAFLIENNIFVNEAILKNGFANLQIRLPNTKYADQLREAYKEARKEKRGLQGE